ncbi:metalloregulator ArsR/SmtB family transcription factor [Streptomyces sp. C10-9-1]|uniref:ArsR/SmtB family transcription factor n=1 Tax=Streptomyces sp. C10-9-1 TaxID=1859285 RepID=UPI0021125918|nr:metalloregulator ArsR/SmtB family transcription factor [Streptomyces sp. C10-9-1]MCQ6553356.1 metalloregulator ArsR/SmtB family transcription factor [Streptomyces sp. C10-9-1]
MKGAVMLDRADAEAYASWFGCLADPTRLQLLHLLATARQPMTVGALAAGVGVGQPTVSGHVRRLAELEFVFVERVGTSSRVRVNPDCLAGFPSAAEVVMGQAPVRVDSRSHTLAPWQAGTGGG